LKFSLHLEEEQRKRLLDRLQEPSKRWKFSRMISRARTLGKYLAAYQDTITHTATKLAPWHVLPATEVVARVVISSTIVSALEG